MIMLGGLARCCSAIMRLCLKAAASRSDRAMSRGGGGRGVAVYGSFSLSPNFQKTIFPI